MKKIILWATPLLISSTFTTAFAEETVTNETGLSSMYGFNGEFEACSEVNPKTPAPQQKNPVDTTVALPNTGTATAQQTEEIVEPPASGTSSMYATPGGTVIYNEDNDFIAQPIQTTEAQIQPTAQPERKITVAPVKQPVATTEPVIISTPAEPALTAIEIAKAKQQLYAVSQLAPTDYVSKIVHTSLYLIQK